MGARVRGLVPGSYANHMTVVEGAKVGVIDTNAKLSSTPGHMGSHRTVGASKTELGGWVKKFGDQPLVL